jgi:hypothetical protein
MGLFSKNVAEVEVAFAGIREYAESGEEERVISAQVEITEKSSLGGKDSLPFFGPLGATRLLSMLRREQHYVIPFMTLVESVAEELDDSAADLSDFSVRGSVVTDPEILSMMIGDSESGGGPWAGNAIRTAELNSTLPMLVQDLPSRAERTTKLELHRTRGRASVRFKFGLGSSNALTTMGAWAATVDHLVRLHPPEQMAIPVGRGLKALHMIWTNMEFPRGVSIAESTAIEQDVTETVAVNTL